MCSRSSRNERRRKMDLSNSKHVYDARQAHNTSYYELGVRHIHARSSKFVEIPDRWSCAPSGSRSSFSLSRPPNASSRCISVAHHTFTARSACFPQKAPVFRKDRLFPSTNSYLSSHSQLLAQFLLPSFSSHLPLKPYCLFPTKTTHFHFYCA
jgi:hypothetical protein